MSHDKAVNRLGEHLEDESIRIDRDLGTIGSAKIADAALAFIRDAIHADGETGDAVREALGLRVEWTVRHCQGTHTGPFTREQAERWAQDDIARDEHRRPERRGKTRLVRRVVGEWQEVKATSSPG